MEPTNENNDDLAGDSVPVVKGNSEVSVGAEATYYSPVSVGAQIVPGASSHFIASVESQMGLRASSYSPVTVGAQMGPGASIYSPFPVGFQMRSSGPSGTVETQMSHGASGYSPVTFRAQISPRASSYFPVTVGAHLPTAVSPSSGCLMGLGIPENTEAFVEYENSVSTEKELRFIDL